MGEDNKQESGPFIFALIACVAYFLLLWLTADSHMRQYWEIRDLQYRIGQLEEQVRR